MTKAGESRGDAAVGWPRAAAVGIGGWLRRGAGGAKPPFDAVWRTERPRVRALAARLTGGDPDAAEDVAQEVAVRALRGYEAFRGDADVRTWLYRITLNVVRSGARSATSGGEGNDAVVGGDAAAEAADAAAAPRDEGPEARLLRAEGSAPAVRRALDALPEELRTALVLQVYEEMKCREIATLLGVPLGTVLSRLHAARTRLRATLTEGDFHDAL